MASESELAELGRAIRQEIIKAGGDVSITMDIKPLERAIRAATNNDAIIKAIETANNQTALTEALNEIKKGSISLKIDMTEVEAALAAAISKNDVTVVTNAISKAIGDFNKATLELSNKISLSMNTQVKQFNDILRADSDNLMIVKELVKGQSVTAAAVAKIIEMQVETNANHDKIVAAQNEANRIAQLTKRVIQDAEGNIIGIEVL